MENASSTLAASDANPSDIISALQALQIKGVKDKDMEGILEDILENHEVKEWENLLAAAPSALYALGRCFLVALSGDMPQITQKRDPTIPADLRTNLVHCSDLGLETFMEAEYAMGNLRTTIAAITEYRGIMDQILGSIHDIKTALDLKFDEDLKESSEELAELLGDLEYISRKATDHIELVVKKFTEWHSGVRKIRLAYTETQSIETESREKLKEESEDLLAELKKIGDGDENPNQLKKIGRWIKKKKDIEALQTIRSDFESGFRGLDTRRMDKESVIAVLSSCLDNLERIIKSLELLPRFFQALYRQIEDLSKNRLATFIRDVTRKKLTQRKVDDIHYDAFKIRCQYMHAEIKASIYAKASREHITPGVKLLSGLNSGPGVSDSDMEKKCVELDELYEDALNGIHVFVERLPTHAQLMKQIEDGALASEE